MILRNLWRRGTRSLLTVLGIAVGVAAVVGLGAMAEGIAANYSGAMGLTNDLLVSQANAVDVVLSSLDETLGERIAAVPDVDNLDPGVFGWIAVGNMPYFLVYGYELGSVAADHYRIVEGKPVQAGRTLALGARAAEALSLGVDDTLRLNGIPFRIVGIYETGQGMEESGALMSLSDAQTVSGKTRAVSVFQVGVRVGANLEQVVERIRLIDDSLSVSTSSEYENQSSMTEYLQAFAWGVAAIAVLVGGLGMMSAMVMTVLERTREIGTLRAVGWGRGRVLRLILGEAVALSLAGGVVGVLLGILLAWAAGRMPGVGAMVAGGVSPGVMVQGMVTALVLGLVGGLYPAWTAANLQPVEALRYEGGAGTSGGGMLARVGPQSFRNLWRRRTRTLMSAAGIGVGVATLVMIGGMIDGLMQTLNGLAATTGTGNITIMQREVADMSLSSLDERMVSQIAAMPGVASASPALLGFVMTEALPLFILTGVDPGTAAGQHFKVVEGRSLQRPNEVMVGRTAADSFNLAVGDTLQLYDNRYKIAGVYETGSSWEDAGGVLNLIEAQNLLSRPRAVSFIFVDVSEPRQAGAVVEAINRRWPEARATLASEFAQNTNDMQTSAAMMNAIRMLAILVGGIVVANTMIMSIFERTREIGTLRAVGWSGGRIVRQVMEESLLLCLLAAGLGSVGGVLLMEAVGMIPGFGGFLTPRWSVATFATAVGVALLLGLMGGLWPAWRASRLQPVEALRYE